MLINMEVFKKTAYPWFSNPYVKVDGQERPIKYGEDFYFCQKATKAGFTTHCALDLSESIGHIGVKTNYGFK
jgi:hypothetical protein